MKVPTAWRDFDCSDYFESPLAEHGWRDEESQYWYIHPMQHLREDPGRGFLIVGGAGVDGIEWGYRKGMPGIWAHYPIDDEFVRIANGVDELREGFARGTIRV